jgi:hypothetical protein
MHSGNDCYSHDRKKPAARRRVFDIREKSYEDQNLLLVSCYRCMFVIAKSLGIMPLRRKLNANSVKEKREP